jgi:hypothetical protein
MSAFVDILIVAAVVELCIDVFAKGRVRAGKPRVPQELRWRQENHQHFSRGAFAQSSTTHRPRIDYASTIIAPYIRKDSRDQLPPYLSDSIGE